MWHHGWHADGVNAHQRHLEPQCGVNCRPWWEIIHRKVPLNSLCQRSSPALSTQSSADRGFSFASLSLPFFLACHKVSPRKSKFISNGYSSEQLVALFTKLGAISLLIHVHGPLIGPLLVSDLNHDIPVLPFPQLDGQEHRRLPVTGSSHHERTTQLPRSHACPNAWRPIFAAGHPYGTAKHSTRNWMRWERHRLTVNVGMSTAYWFSILKISRMLSYNCFHFAIPVSCQWVRG